MLPLGRIFKFLPNALLVKDAIKHSTFLLAVSPQFPLSCDGADLFVMTGTARRSAGSIFCRMLLWNLTSAFLIRLELRVLGKKTTQVKCRFHHVIPGVHATNLCWMVTTRLSQLVRAFIPKLFFPVLTVLYTLGEEVSPYLSGKLSSPLSLYF